ncbi:RDD family protein [Streptomyces sp. NPDC005907]|uniref:RDD family protein n=1 Tax=Streptomyces sp. NPDC005907 TaxID=3154571 RepID=UPI0033F5B8A3
MSAPTPAPGDDRPREGYYPDPSIPGYVRYWNGASWVPGTSRPAPTDGVPLAPPAGTRPASGPAPATGRSVPAARGGTPAAEKTGPHFFDEDPQPPAEPHRPPAEAQHGSRPEPASAWGADRSWQSGFGGDQDRRVSWGADRSADPRVPHAGGPVDPVAQPDGRSTRTDGTTTIPPATADEDSPHRLAPDGTVVFRRLPGGTARPGTATDPADPGTPAGNFVPTGSGNPGTGNAGSANAGAYGTAATGNAGAAPGTFGAAGTGNSGAGNPGSVGTGNAGSANAGVPGAANAGAVAGTFGAVGPGNPGAGNTSAAGAGAGVFGPAGAGPLAAEAGSIGAQRSGHAAPAGAGTFGPAGAATGRPGGPQVPGPAGAGQPAGTADGPLAPEGTAPRTPSPRTERPAGPQTGPAAAAAPQTPSGTVPPQSADPAATPMSPGAGGGQPSWAQQVHRLAGAADEGQPVVPWKPPVDDVFQAAARAQAAARPAGLGRRLAARLVDTVVVAAVTAVAAVPLGARAVDHVNDKIDAAKRSGETVTVWLLDGTTATCLGVVLAVLLLFGVLYEVLPTARWGRTLGKKLCGLQVRDIEGGEPPTFALALRRWLVYSVPGVLVIGLVGVVWCLFDRPWRQCLHDKAAHTFVAA